MKPNGSAIQAFREARELGNRELARRVGISSQFLLRIQEGSRGASPKTLGGIARELEVPVDAIVRDAA